MVVKDIMMDITTRKIKAWIINNNNNNTNIVAGAGDGNVTDACEECFNANLTLAGIITYILELQGPIILPAFPEISIGADVVTIAQLCDFLEEQISEGNIPQTSIIEVIDSIFDRDTEISAGVSEESFEALVECLLDVDFGGGTDNNTRGLAPFNTNTATSDFDINTGGLPSSFSPPTIAQEPEESSALKIEKLKQQWLELLP
jgi:hypothetical protein